MLKAIDHRETMPPSQRHYQRAMGIYERVRCGDQAAARSAPKRRRGSLDLCLVTHRRCRKLGGECCRVPSEIAQENGVVWRRQWVEQERYSLDPGGNLLDQLQPFPEHREVDE